MRTTLLDTCSFKLGSGFDLLTLSPKCLSTSSSTMTVLLKNWLSIWPPQALSGYEVSGNVRILKDSK